MRSGQIAMEFIATYGYAVLSVLLVAACLGYYLGWHNVMLPSKCNAQLPFVCVEYKAAQDGSILLGIQNTAGDIISADMTFTCAGEQAAQTFSQSQLLTTNSRLNGSLVRFSCPLQGSVVRAQYTITYAFSSETKTHDVQGSIRIHKEK